MRQAADVQERPKQWHVGIADESWKVVICGRDIHRVDDILSALSYYLTDAGSNTKKGLLLIRKMSGAQIIEALEQHKRTSALTVERALIKSASAEKIAEALQDARRDER